jgi:5-formyltetrahydrofolate cyclo-ligase
VVWLIPGVGFDRRGRRLGRGGGYYDRTLSEASVTRGLLGLGFTCQLIEAVPADENDWRMNWIITPETCIAVQGSNI